MQNKRGKRFILSVAVMQIVLIVMMSVSISFFISENLISAEVFLPDDNPEPLPKTVSASPEQAQSGFLSDDVSKYYHPEPLPKTVTAPTGTNSPPNAVKTVGKKEYKFLGQTVRGGWGHLAQGVMWAVFAAGAIQIIGGLAGFDKELSNALSISVFAGIMGGQFVKGLVVKQAAGQQTATTLGGKLTAGQAGFASGLLIAAAIFI